jgi:hypothetical protein
MASGRGRLVTRKTEFDLVEGNMIRDRAEWVVFDGNLAGNA